jgi:hypothetical protein
LCGCESLDAMFLSPTVLDEHETSVTLDTCATCWADGGTYRTRLMQECAGRAAAAGVATPIGRLWHDAVVLMANLELRPIALRKRDEALQRLESLMTQQPLTGWHRG